LEEFSPDLDVDTGTKLALAFVTTALCLAGIAIGIALWRRSAEQPQLEPDVLKHGWYVDETYAKVFGDGGEAAAELAASVDQGVIDGAVNGVGNVVRGTGGIVRRLQTGYVRNYALGITAGAVLVLGWAFYVRVGA
jgi:NADH-quinone oxidoreductase subunit L